MAVPKQHRSKSRQGQRRMHVHLNPSKTISCSTCGKALLPHTVCMECGRYKGRGDAVIDVFKKLDKKERKKREKDLEAQGQTSSNETGQAQKESSRQPAELSPEQLSRGS